MRRVRLVLVLALVFVLAWLFLPLRWTPPPAGGRPAANYGEAQARLRLLEVRDHAVAVMDSCGTYALDHGYRTERCYVLLHGFTNCPRQFDMLAARLHATGANVLLPRMPRHGIENADKNVLSDLTAAELVATAEEAVNIAHGLGEHVSLVGLSTSAVVAAWVAEHRSDVDQVMLIAPAFAPKEVPGLLSVPVTAALLRAPNFFFSWPDTSGGPKSTFPGFASHALLRVYQLGAHVLEAAPPSHGTHALVVTSAGDEAVNNGITKGLAERWIRAGVPTAWFEFPRGLGVEHDMIDPEQPYQRVRLTYPLIQRFLTTGRPPLLADSAAVGGGPIGVGAETGAGPAARDSARAGRRNEVTTSRSSAPSQGASRK